MRTADALRRINANPTSNLISLRSTFAARCAKFVRWFEETAARERMMLDRQTAKQRLEFRHRLVGVLPRFFAQPRSMDHVLKWIRDRAMHTNGSTPRFRADSCEELLVQLFKFRCLA